MPIVEVRYKADIDAAGVGLKVKLFPASQLGTGEELLEDTIRGNIDLVHAFVYAHKDPVLDIKAQDRVARDHLHWNVDPELLQARAHSSVALDLPGDVLVRPRVVGHVQVGVEPIRDEVDLEPVRTAGYFVSHGSCRVGAR